MEASYPLNYRCRVDLIPHLRFTLMISLRDETGTIGMGMCDVESWPDACPVRDI